MSSDTIGNQDATVRDLRLLTLAAQVAGVKYDAKASQPNAKSGAWWGLWLTYDDEPGEYARRYWNPLTDDGDALRLAVKLDLTICPGQVKVGVMWWRRPALIEEDGVIEPHGNDSFAATRRAIVRAAAEMADGTTP